MEQDEIKKIIKDYLESNEGNMDMHGLIPDGAANTEAMAEKITEKVWEYIRYEHYMEVLDRSFSQMR